MILFTSLRFSDVFGLPALPGCAPGRALTFFASPKKVSKERRAEVRAPSGFLALLASGGVGLNSLRSNNARPDPPAAALLSPATRHGGPNSRNAKLKCRTPQGRAMARPCCFGYWYEVHTAVMRRRVAQGQTDQGWRCLSVASLARPRLDRATQRARAAGRRIRLAFLLGTLLWRSKEKYLACRGETRLATKANPSANQQTKPLYNLLIPSNETHYGNLRTRR